MKTFKVYVGQTEDNMIEAISGALKNDPEKETFSIRHRNSAGILFPTRYVKILPISAHDPHYHTSIWYVALSGVSDEAYMKIVCETHEEARSQYHEASVLRHVLKHLRKRRFLTPFADILSRCGIQLEHPRVTDLYDNIVLQGNWPHSEELLQRLASEGLFDEHQRASPPRAEWTRLHGLDADGDAPCRRGGHAMCMDEENGLIYLFGGWDGQRNLDDFWVYDVRADLWRLLSLATGRDLNGPGPRSCHKMAFDRKTGSIYVLGRLLDSDDVDQPATNSGGVNSPSDSSGVPDIRAASASHTVGIPRAGSVTRLVWPSTPSEFYRYHTRGLDAGKWDLLTMDTQVCGGPPLIYDHQMVVDSEAQGSWKELRVPGAIPTVFQRFGHSMLLEPSSHTLIILAGQYREQYAADMHAYHIPTGTLTELFPSVTASGGPEACFTQRAAIDPDLKEIYVFYGLIRDSPGVTVLDPASSVWVYRYDRPDRPGKWSNTSPANTSGSNTPHGDPISAETPQPRYAHQVVYDRRSKIAYMHGGTSGVVTNVARTPSEWTGDWPVKALEGLCAVTEVRLDDLWKLRLERPALSDILRRGLFELRRQHFRELCEDAPPVKALTFLQREGSGRGTRFPLFVVASPGYFSFRSARAMPPNVSSLADSSTQSSSQDADMPNIEAPREELMKGTPALVYTMEVDPQETSRGDSPSPARFKQRTELFEKLLLFVNTSAKEPEKDLSELVNTDREE
ncbi:predicted protein [Postia placenta Mad-698-R]|nr:predicted protein [Postia placenta Mad-698-R]